MENIIACISSDEVSLSKVDKISINCVIPLFSLSEGNLYFF